MNDEKIIRKKYGENMWHLCRKLFPTILEVPGKLSSTMLNLFQPSRSLYHDITKFGLENQFKNIITYMCWDKSLDHVKTGKSPEELLRSVGYTLYTCDTHSDVLKFTKYYKKEERLCSFKDPDRTKNNYVFFAVRDDAEELRREDFTSPERQDKYGTSVISIQFSRDFYNTLSIKNRYNHTVQNPDATFDNDLEQIVPGLTESFAEFYGIREVYSSARLAIPGYVSDINGRFYKVNCTDNDYYYCPDNIMIDIASRTLDMRYSDKNRYLFMDGFVLDLKNKKIVHYLNQNDRRNSQKAFVKMIGKIEDIKITNEDGYKKVVITNSKKKEVTIKLDENGCIIGYINNNVRYLPNGFMNYSNSLKEVQLDRCSFIGDECFYGSQSLEEIVLPNVTSIGFGFCYENQSMTRCIIPKCRFIGDDFLSCNYCLKETDFNNVMFVGYGFLRDNTGLRELEMNSLIRTGDEFLFNHQLEVLKTPKLRKVGTDFLGEDKGDKKEPKVWIRNVEFPKIHHRDEIDYSDPMNMLKR